MTVSERELITVQEAAARYGVSIPAVRGWIRNGLIAAYEQKLPRRVYVDAREIESKREIKPKRVHKDHSEPKRSTGNV